jgi:hypothetical protein
MEKHRYHRVLLTLAIYLFILCATNQASGLICDSLWKCLIFLVSALLILFVVHHTPVLCRVVKSFLANRIRPQFPPATFRLSISQTATIIIISETLAQPFRFQRPPPLSL